MADVIPMDGPRRRAAAKDPLAAGVARASGERTRRARRTPLISSSEADSSAQTAAEAVSAQPPSAPATAVAERETQPASRSPRPVAAKRAPRKAAQASRKAAPTSPASAAPSAAAKPAAAKPAAAKTAAAGDGSGEPVRPVRPNRPARPPRPSRPAPAAARPGAARERAAEGGGAPAGERVPYTAHSSGLFGEQPEVGSGGSLFSLSDDQWAAVLGVAAQVGGSLVEIMSSQLSPLMAEQKLAGQLDFLKRRIIGDYEVDEFGFDPELTDAILMALFRPLYRHWFRVEVRGIQNIPSTGGALVVANHSGAVAVDAVMTGIAVHDEHPDKRFLRMLGADLVFASPVLSAIARKAGATLATNPDAERLLSNGEVVGVWPEGFKGIGKPFSERYRLQRFGRGGFVSAALRTKTPIIPCSIVGAEEIYPLIGNIPSLARLLGLPYLPITPTFPWLGPLGAIPLPSKWLIEFGAPVPTDVLGEVNPDDPMLVFDLTDQVRQTIQQTLYTLLMQRRSVFF